MPPARTSRGSRTSTRRRALPGVALLLIGALLVLAAGCVEVRREVTVDVTPGETPVEIEGARWQSWPLTYCIAQRDIGFVDLDRLEALVTEAFTLWRADVTSDGPCDDVAQGNGRNEIAWGEPGEAEVEIEAAGVHQAGFTRQLFQSCTDVCEGGAMYEIAEADILLSPEPPDPFRNEECLFSTILHETGHFLGVPHLASPAVMAPVTNECPQELTDADFAALAELYGDALAVP